MPVLPLHQTLPDRSGADRHSIDDITGLAAALAAIESGALDGASAYEVAVANGFVGTEQEWLASLVGPAGADGAQGPQGIQGPAGADGDAADIATEIHAATAKTTPDDADEDGYLDSGTAFALVKRTWANTKAALKTYFDTLYAATGHAHSGMGDVVGPASSVDNAIPRFDGATGKLLQDATYNATLSDEGNFAVNPTWNSSGTAFTGLSVNVTDTASATGSWLANFINLQTSLGINRAGNIYGSTASNSNVFPGLLRQLNGTGGYYGLYPSGFFQVIHNDWPFIYYDPNNGLNVDFRGLRFFSAAARPGHGTTVLWAALKSEELGVLSQVNSTTAQTYRLYNTYTNSTNYERATHSWGSNLYTIGTEAAGTGTARDILIKAASGKVRINDAARTPASATAAGSIGEVCWDASYIYVCTATNTWVRAALSTW